MGEEKRVRDIMVAIDQYHKIDQAAKLCDALSILKRDYEELKADPTSSTRKTTLIVTDSGSKIVGKLSMHDIIKGLVPETAKKPEASRAYYTTISSRAMEVADEIRGFQERFQWLHHSFSALVKQEAMKKVKDIMSVVHPLLREDDTVNQAIYVIFKENVRQPLVVRNGEIVGVVDFSHIFQELLEIAGPECGISW